MMDDFTNLSQRFFSMTRINHADWAVAFFSMPGINHVDWVIRGPMDIRDLDYFLARGKAGSFTAAARDAYVVQSAMWSAIARLERNPGGAAVRPGRHANSPDGAWGGACRRAHSGSLTLSRQPGTTLRPSLARSAARLRWEPLSTPGPPAS
jgi:hypothetical protein